MKKHALHFPALLLALVLFIGAYADAEAPLITLNDLPEPVETFAPIPGTYFNFTAADGSSITSSSLKGKPALVVYGNTVCYNTRALLNDLLPAAHLIERAGAEVVVGLVDTFFNYCSLVDYSEDYAAFRCGEQDSYSLYNMLVKCGYTGGGITFPAVFVLNADGNIIYHSTDYVHEPLRLVSLLCSSLEKDPEIDWPEVNHVLILPDSLTKIEDSAFTNLKGITEVRFGGSKITAIGANAFSGCTDLRTVTIPDSVKTIGANAFSGCSKLVICASRGSVAHNYAEANNIPCIVR